MIAQLTGTLIYKSPQNLIIDVGGVGYRVLVSLNSFSVLPEIGNQITIQTYTHLREDQLTLYGFSTLEEKFVFQKLLSVSGVGPKSALTILSGMPADDLVDAITREDAGRLCSTPGIGKKTADRIIVELKDKLAKEYRPIETKIKPVKTRRIYDDVLSALTNLGYQKQSAEKVMKNVLWDENTTIEAAIRQILRELAKS